MYLNHALVLESFKRLRTECLTGRKGKRPMERTSSLMIALAFDITSKKHGVQALDINFNTDTSKKMRSDFALEYAKLVTVSKTEDGLPQSVHELGFVNIGGKDPASRMSSNFMTTQLVSATKSETAFSYPSRPAPLLSLGKVATGMLYGVQLHDDWQNGMMQHLGDVTSNTPFTDLAMFCLRYMPCEPKNSLVETLSDMLRKKFSRDVAGFWVTKIKTERFFAKHLMSAPFAETNLIDSLATLNNTRTRQIELMKHSKEQLVEMVIRLENGVKQ